MSGQGVVACVEGLLVVAVALVGAAGFGLWRRRVDGRLRPVAGERAQGIVPSHEAPDPRHVLTAAELGQALGRTATFVSFSTAFCQPCRANRQVLGHLAAATDAVAHVEIDAESRLDLVRRLGVSRTPTTLVLDGSGTIRHRATGVLHLADARAAVGELANG